MEIESYAFSADINQLLSLIINAVYSNKDVFLRELISNASDALNKARYQSLTNTEYLDVEPNFEIKISFDRNNKKLIIRDSGIGMTKDELINNLGTIASSGTKKFLESLTNKELQLIGQFGVGFYSAYLVADKVQVISKHVEDEQYTWESLGDGTFNVHKDETDYGLKRGSILMLHLKDEMIEYLEESSILNLINKHNQFIEFPIYLETQKTREFSTETVQAEDIVNDDPVMESNDTVMEGNDAVMESNDTVMEGDDAVMKTDIDTEIKDMIESNNDEADKALNLDNFTDADAKVNDLKTVETYVEFEQVNKEKPLWNRNPKDVSKEEYENFYKSLTGETDTYLDVVHFHVEGNVEFKGVLYIPKRSPVDLFDGQTKRKGMVKLYSRRVFITDDCEDLLPEYMKFVRGVIETQDIPLNISRETLQHNKILKVIGKNVVKQIIGMCNKLSEDPDKFKIFYEQYSKSVKLGIHEDTANRNKLTPFLRYETSKSNGEQVSLDNYIDNMKSEQQIIYYITAESTKSIISSPFLEKLKSKDYEIIFMTDPLDEYITQQVKDYNDKKLSCITKENIEFNDTEVEKKEFEKSKVEYKNVCDYIKSTLDNEVEKVVISNKLDSSPCILSTSDFGWTANMQRILKAQTFNKNEMSYMMGSKILEINPNNKIIQKIKHRLDLELIDTQLSELVTVLYNLTLQSSGFTLDNPSKFNNSVLNLIDDKLNMSIDESTNSSQSASST